MISEQLLIAKGYKRFKSQLFEYSDFQYQKRFDDAIGKRYFVNFVHYPKIIKFSTESWMAEMIVNEPHMQFKMHSIGDLTIGSVERRMLTFWKAMGKHYYEKF